LSSSDAGHKSKVDFRKSKVSIIGGDNDVTEKGKLKASSERLSIDGCDNGFFCGSEAGVENVENFITDVVFVFLFEESLDISPCAKYLRIGTLDDDCIDSWVSL
jgi:hypothetical protein